MRPWCRRNEGGRIYGYPAVEMACAVGMWVDPGIVCLPFDDVLVHDQWGEGRRVLERKGVYVVTASGRFRCDARMSRNR